MTAKQLSDGNPDGTILGESGGKIGFLGKTPIARQAAITTGADTTTEFTAAIDSIIAVLKNFGLTD